MTTMKSQMMKAVSFPNEGVTGTSTILLVEDEPTVREVTREVLEHAGYKVLECDRAEEALLLASKHQGAIDLLLTDVVMPGMNGADLAHRLQSTQPDLVTVFMSGYADIDVVHKIRKTSAIHIQKPFTVNVLLARIGQALRKHPLSDEARSLPTLST
jgi:two-component system cell cycle sensor histidine kinase/response regulator CckA